MPRQVNTSTNWTNTFQMLADEFGQLYGERPASSPTPPDMADGTPDAVRAPVLVQQRRRHLSRTLRNLYRDFHAEPAFPRSALCLSGGGIRSAAFALGVIQFLAKAGLLHRFEYLSTVSGGGYIGSWLSAWSTRAADAQGKGAYAKIRPQLACREMPEHEPQEIENLRANSNYLDSQAGRAFRGYLERACDLAPQSAHQLVSVDPVDRRGRGDTADRLGAHGCGRARRPGARDFRQFKCTATSSPWSCSTARVRAGEPSG